MGKPGPETRLVAAIRKAVKERHPQAWVLKVHGSPYQPGGTPDLLLCIEGRLLSMEVKAPQQGESRARMLGRVTELQWTRIEEVRAAGGVAGVATSVEEALALVAKLDLTIS